MTETLQRPDGAIAHDDTGGPGLPVIAAPGMGDLRQVYRHLRSPLVERGVRLVTMDLRGVGESSLPWPDYSDAAIGSDMLALAAHLESGPAVLVGNSLTASSAVIAATDDPASVAGLVLIGPFARDVPTPGWKKALFRLTLTPPWGKSAWVSYYGKQMYPGTKPPDHDDYVRSLEKNLGENGRFQAFRSLAFNSHAESGRRLHNVTCPVVVIMGTADPDFPDPAAEARQLATVLSAELLLLDGIGHYPQVQAPSQVAEAVASLVTQVR